MTIDEAVNLIQVKCLENREKKWINDPVAYTLYEVWKIADSKVIYSPAERATTNADRIRAMSDEELAERLCCPKYVCPEEYLNCRNCILDWLQSPAEGGDGDG